MINPVSNVHLILVDWGTTNFRAYLIDESGQCIEEKSSSSGISRIKGEFETTLTEHIGDWLTRYSDSVVILCGMVGSQIGWFNTSYVACPAEISGFGRDCFHVPSFNQGNCWIVPGMIWETESRIDVMRGEELQVIGACRLLPENDTMIFCCPGTHTKWVSVADNLICSISTAMTGELFSLLAHHSVLTNSLDTDATLDERAFLAGLEYSKLSGGLLNHLFSVRAQFVSGKHERLFGSGYLSGLLIGHEIQSVISSKSISSDVLCNIIGSSSLCQLYQIGLNYFGIASRIIPDKVASVAGANSVFQSLKDKICHS